MNRQVQWWIGILIACTATGCVGLPARSRPPAAATSPTVPSVDAYYSYTPRAVEDRRELIREKPQFRQWAVRFQSVAPTIAAEETITCEWFEPKVDGKRPAILVYPILGGDYPIERGFARFFAEHGMHAVLIYRQKLKFSREHDAAHMEALFRQGILKGRQVVDWLERQPTVDAAHIGGFGISMGGMQAVITAACEPRITAHVMCLAGGSIAELLSQTRDNVVLKPRNRYLKETGHDVAWLTAELVRVMRSDPLLLAPHVETAQALFIAARFDHTIPRPLSQQLWRALGHPEFLTIPTGHYTAILALPFIRWRALKWYRARWQLPDVN